MSKDRRKEPRIEAHQLRLIAHDSLAGKLFGSVTNLSSQGLMLIGGRHVEQGGIVQLDLRRATTPDQIMMEMGVRVSWVSPANTPGSQWIGAQIIAISDPHAEILKRLIMQAEASAPADSK